MSDNILKLILVLLLAFVNNERIFSLTYSRKLDTVNENMSFTKKSGCVENTLEGSKVVYLTPNLVNGKNVLTQDMLSKSNTRYVIQYDYDLNGTEIIIPEGCILDFQGGSFTKGKINFKNTLLIGAINLYCDCDGIVKNEMIEVDWFGADSKGEKDNIKCFKSVSNIISARSGGIISFSEGGTYLTSIEEKHCRPEVGYDLAALVLKDCNNVQIKMNNATIKVLPNHNNSYSIIRGINCRSFIVENGFIIGDGESHDYTPTKIAKTHEWCYGLNVSSCNAVIRNMNISYLPGDGIYCGSYHYVDTNERSAGSACIENCEISYCGRQGITVTSNRGFVLKNTEINHIGTWSNNPGFAPKAGIQFEYEDQLGFKGDIFIDNISIKNVNGNSIGSASVNGYRINNVLCNITNSYLGSNVCFTSFSPLPNVENCEIVVNKGANNYIWGSYTNCKIKIESQLTTHNSINGSFNKCEYLNLSGVEHNLYLIDGSKISNCTIDGFKSAINRKKGIVIYDSNIVNTIFTNSLVSIESASNIEINKNIFKNCSLIRQGNSNITFDSCEFENVLTQYNKTPIKLNRCQIKYNLKKIDDDSNNVWIFGFLGINAQNCTYDVQGLLSNIRNLNYGIGYINNSDIKFGKIVNTKSIKCVCVNCMIIGTNLLGNKM